MIETCYTHARAELARLLDEVNHNRETVIIHRRRQADVALIAAAELDALVETAHLLRSPRGAARLLAALDRARAGKREGRRPGDAEMGAGTGVGDAGETEEEAMTEAEAAAREEEAGEGRLALFAREFLDDLRFWIESDGRTALRVLEIVEDTLREAPERTGTPGPLRHRLAGAWSRRLTQEHRVVFLASGRSVTFLQARYHY